MKYLVNIIVFIILSLCITVSARSSTVTLAWDASTSSQVTGYKLYYGTQSRVYTTTVDVGNVLEYKLTSAPDTGPIYFAATAYDANGNESDYSTELKCYTVTSSITGNGTISPSTPYVMSTDMSTKFTFTPASNYQLGNVALDGTSLGAPTSYTVTNPTTTHNLAVTFLQVPTAPASIHVVSDANVSAIGGKYEVWSNSKANLTDPTTTGNLLASADNNSDGSIDYDITYIAPGNYNWYFRNVKDYGAYGKTYSQFTYFNVVRPTTLTPNSLTQLNIILK